METALVVAKFAIMYGLPAAMQLVEMFKLKDPTQADWDKLFTLASKSYDTYIQEAKDRATS